MLIMEQFKRLENMINKVIVIAEAGVNHNGSIELAKKLIDTAAEAKADYVKFQTFITEKGISRKAKKADYQLKNIASDDDSQFNMIKKLELSHEDHYELITYCYEKNIKFLSSAFDLESIDFLITLKLGIWKIPSGEITNYPYLKKIAAQREPVLLSTGLCDLKDIENALSILYQFGLKREQITLLHCNTEYPTPMKDVNIFAMQTIANKFGVNVGYSDHTKGIEIPIAAVALGASVIEKHFTLNRNMAGPDHAASLEPTELIAMVSAIRNVELALSGSGNKEPSTSEIKNINVVRKSIVAAQEIGVGEIFSENNLTVKRPGTGINPMLWESLIGQKAKKSYKPDDLIEN